MIKKKKRFRALVKLCCTVIIDGEIWSLCTYSTGIRRDPDEVPSQVNLPHGRERAFGWIRIGKVWIDKVWIDKVGIG